MQEDDSPQMPESAHLDLTDAEVDGFIAAVQEHADGGALRRRIEEALDESIDRCARCKVCDRQVDAVMQVLGYG